MPLKTSKPTSSGDGGGIFIDKVVIVDVKDFSGKTTEYIKYPNDIAVEVPFSKSGLDWNPSMLIGGNFKKDEQTTAVLDWGGAFPVRDFFGRLSAEAELTEDNTLPPELLSSMVGKEMFTLSYRTTRQRNGKFTYSTWKEIGAIDDGEDDLRARFQRSLKRGYPKNANVGELSTPASEPWAEETSSDL